MPEFIRRKLAHRSSGEGEDKSQPAMAESKASQARSRASTGGRIEGTEIVECSLPKALYRLYKALILAASGLGESEFGVKKRTLPIENLKVGGDAAAIARVTC